MRLIGMLDSPYVRRVAVSLNLLGLEYTHEPVSVFRNFDHFRSINPVVKAPTFVTDDGTVLMDSSLILEHIERIASRSLMPKDLGAHTRALRQIGLALAACEKSVSIIYERNLRPVEKQHQPWLDRVAGQLRLAYAGLEAEVSDGWFQDGDILQPEITAAVAWRFTRHVLPDVVRAGDVPKLVALSARAEALPAFRKSDFTEFVISAAP
jgi:glutathione S-transferase